MPLDSHIVDSLSTTLCNWYTQIWTISSAFLDSYMQLNFINFGHIHTYRLVVLVFLFDFLISVIFNHSCSLLSYYFSHVQKVNVRRCDLFGHLQIFRSYSFGHVESVKWFTLYKGSVYLQYFSKPWLENAIKNGLKLWNFFTCFFFFFRKFISL